MATQTAKRCNATIQRLAERMEKAGKPFKAVMTAFMRKLLILHNRMIREGKRWITSSATEQK